MLVIGSILIVLCIIFFGFELRNLIQDIRKARALKKEKNSDKLKMADEKSKNRDID